ncbi:DUF5696 domain-containing protein [Pseudoneobacillus sp. C159]
MYRKLLIAFILIIVPVHVIADAVQQSKSEQPLLKSEKVQTEMKLTSAAYTKPENRLGEKVEQTVSFEGFERVTENSSYSLFVDPKSLAIKIRDKHTGYVWNSGLDHPEQYRINKTWTQMIQSAVTIEYADQKGKVKTESILTNQSRPKVTKTQKGFQAKVFLNQAKLQFQLSVELEDDQILVSIPKESIVENKKAQLISLKVYPFFGAAHQNDINGYMFLPDGSGALVRYEKSKKRGDTPFVGAIFGRDEAFERTNTSFSPVNPVQQMKMPIFGAVHGVKQNAFLTVIEDGYAYGDILAYSAGVSTDFNWITAQFHYRYAYYQPTSKRLNGINLYQDKANDVNIKLRYLFLKDEHADYVGMAKRYQQYLVNHGQLTKQDDKVEVRLEFLGGEAKSGLLWDSVIPMTELNQIPVMTDELKQHQVDNLFVIYKGWSKGGLTGTLPAKFPLERKLGSSNDLKETTAALNKNDIPLYFHTDYTKAYEGASGYSGGKDVAKKISSETISLQGWKEKVFYLSPLKSLQMAKEDVGQFEKQGITNLAIDSTGYTLFSDFSKSGETNRMQTLATYSKLFQEMNQKMGGVALYEPSVYAWNQADRYLDIPMFSSGYVFETDTVPFLQIVLKGYMPYFAPFSNFHASPVEEMLRMIEFGAYPSFLLTEQPSYLLMKTASGHVYTSEFSIWKDAIVKQYQQIEKSLGQVEGATIINREIPEAGIAEVTYSNGKIIIVNYTDVGYQRAGILVPAKDFAITERRD